MIAASLVAVDRKACYKADSVCQVMTGVEEVSSIKKYMPVLASWLATTRFETKFIQYGMPPAKLWEISWGILRGLL